MPNYGYGAHAFALKSFQNLIDNREKLVKWIKEYSPIEHVSPDDPPIALFYWSGEDAKVGDSPRDPVHSPIQGLVLEEKLKKAGVDVILVYPGRPNAKYKSSADYLIDRLRKSPESPPPEARDRLRVNSKGTKTITFKGTTIDAVMTFEGSPTSYRRRGKDKFSVGYFVKDGIIIKKNSLLADQDAPVATLDLRDYVASGEGINAVIATGKGTALTLTGSINVSDNGHGKNASDFSGLGAQIIASDHAKVNVNSMRIDTKGFLRAAFISDNHAQILVKDTTVTAMGANPLTQAYDGYLNSANQGVMLSPPWVLGIQGGIRAGNMLGGKSTLTVINSKISSGGWAVLSTDACTNPVMNVVDSTLDILPESKGGMSSGKFSYSTKYGSGYGTYFTGNARENFYGVTFKGLTYAGIYTGGEGTYRSSKGTIELKDAEGRAMRARRRKGQADRH